MNKVYGLMADLHLHNWSAFSEVGKNGINTRLQGLLNEIYRCAKEVKEAGGKCVVIAGDVFHVRGSVSPTVLNATRDMFAKIHKELGIYFVIMPGNHDLESKDSTRLSSAVTALESGNVHVCNEPAQLTDVLEHRRIVLVPWYENIEKLKEIILKFTSDPVHGDDVHLILHAPIDGVIPGLPEHGLTPDFLAYNLDVSVERVFAGHYHNHKSFHRGKVQSIGALAHHTWGDVGSKAGFLLVYPDKVVWRKSHLPEFIDLSKIVDLDENDIPLMVDKNYVRVRVESSKISEVEAAKQELLELGAAAVLVQAMPKPPAREPGAVIRVKSSDSLEESIAAFASTIPGVSKEALNKEVMEIYAKVSSGALV